MEEQVKRFQGEGIARWLNRNPAGKLEFVKPGVEATLFQKFLVGTRLPDFSMVEDQDPVRPLYR